MKSVKAFIFDVDGVLTNNEVLVTEAGELLRTMHVRDGQAIKWAIQAGYPVCVITGGRSEGAKKRLTELGVEEYYSGVKDKLIAFQSFMQRTGVLPQEICYMGDDLPDLPVLRKVSLSACPADAVPEVKLSAILFLKFKWRCRLRPGDHRIRDEASGQMAKLLINRVGGGLRYLIKRC